MNKNIKVNFVIAGTQKSGTSALLHFLRQHPQIFMPKNEVHFFEHDNYFSNFAVDYELYHKFFLRKKEEQIGGEKSPNYIFLNQVVERIYNYNPAMKLIFVLRNPIERAYSDYMMMKNLGREKLPFSVAIRLEEWRKRSTALLAQEQYGRYAYIERGYYSQQIKKYFQFFPKKQMLFFKNEDLRDNHQSTLDQSLAFLGVNSAVAKISSKIINGRDYCEMTELDRNYLYKKFEYEIEDLEVLLGWNCDSWRH